MRIVVQWEMTEDNFEPGINPQRRLLTIHLDNGACVKEKLMIDAHAEWPGGPDDYFWSRLRKELRIRNVIALGGGKTPAKQR